MRSRYDLMEDSTYRTTQGTFYKDVFTYPTRKFQYKEAFEEVTLVADDVIRPDLLMLKYYNAVEFDDILFWLNNLGLIYDKEPGNEIELPSKSDLENFYYESVV